MGLKRLIWRSTGLGRTVDTVRNIIYEGERDEYENLLDEHEKEIDGLIKKQSN